MIPAPRGLLVRACAAAVTAAALAGCATAHRDTTATTTIASAKVWSGRIAVRVGDDPAQASSGGFELSGDADAGHLRLISPLGQIVAELAWGAGHATLTQAGRTQAYASLDAMIAASLGADIPARTLFDWLEGRGTALPGWSVDLSRHGEGRLFAVRHDPPPRAELRLALDRP